MDIIFVTIYCILFICLIFINYFNINNAQITNKTQINNKNNYYIEAIKDIYFYNNPKAYLTECKARLKKVNVDEKYQFLQNLTFSKLMGIVTKENNFDFIGNFLCFFYKFFRIENILITNNNSSYIPKIESRIKNNNSLFILPNGLVINKNYKLKNEELKNYWKNIPILKNNFIPTFDIKCTMYPCCLIEIFGYHNNENLKIFPQHCVCACNIHSKLLKKPINIHNKLIIENNKVSTGLLGTSALEI